LNDFFKTSLEHYERFIYQNLDFFNMKRIKYEFFKMTKVKDKINKIWTLKSNFTTIFCRGTFSNVLNTYTKNCLKIQEFKHKLNKFELRRD